MASEKPTRILRSKSRLSAEEIAALEDAEAWRVIYSLPPVPRVADEDPRLQVCFTGFERSQKEALVAMAKEAGLRVMGNVSRNLHWLVVGETAGPKKLEKAAAQGVEVFDESSFRVKVQRVRQ